MTLTNRISVKRGGFATVLAVLAMLFPAWGVAQSDATLFKRTTCSTADFKNDARLGPLLLPNSGPVGKLLKNYHRFDDMTSTSYLATYYDTLNNTWRYPPQGGYALTDDNTPIRMQMSIFAGQRIDRFGSEFGSYLSPEGTPYSARAIPPQSLNNTTNPAACNYSRYRVLQTFPVYGGPIAEGLGQPGLGIQYVLDASIFPGNPSGFNVGYLVANGYLARVTT